MTIWVLWWRYYDQSASGLLRAYTREDDAKRDWEMLRELSDRDIKLDAVDLLGDGSVRPTPAD